MYKSSYFTLPSLFLLFQVPLPSRFNFVSPIPARHFPPLLLLLLLFLQRQLQHFLLCCIVFKGRQAGRFGEDLIAGDGGYGCVKKRRGQEPFQEALHPFAINEISIVIKGKFRFRFIRRENRFS